jgi:hypothetical protein
MNLPIGRGDRSCYSDIIFSQLMGGLLSNGCQGLFPRGKAAGA